MSKRSIRTDLAVEAHEFYNQQVQANQQVQVNQQVQANQQAQTNQQTQENENAGQPEGIEVENLGTEDIKITRVKIVSEKGAEMIGKPMGNYITLEVPRLKENDQELYEETCKQMAKELIRILKLKKDTVVLVVGLGNWNVTPDALGPKVISSLMVTRHLLEHVPEQVDEGVRPVCAIAPGVLGITGIETGEIVKGVVEKIKPGLVIAIDALASRKMERVSTTIQISDTGISPGSGVGNKRMELSANTLGVPVIAIGVPTVVDAATMANDAIDLVLDTMVKEAAQGTDFYNMLKTIDRDEKYELIKEVLNPYIGNLIVTPKEIDDIIEKISKVVANGLNIALHEGITLDDVNRYIQ